MTKFEAPIQEGPLVNPDWSHKDNTQYDASDHGSGESSAIIRQRLSLESPNEEVPETPDEEVDVDQVQTEAVRIAKRNIKETEKRSGKGPTRYRSPRDTGPPPHIAKQVHEDQGRSTI